MQRRNVQCDDAHKTTLSHWCHDQDQLLKNGGENMREDTAISRKSTELETIEKKKRTKHHICLLKEEWNNHQVTLFLNVNSGIKKKKKKRMITFEEDKEEEYILCVGMCV